MNIKNIALGIAGSLMLSAGAETWVHYPMEQLDNPVKNFGTAESASAVSRLITPASTADGVVGKGFRIFGMADGLTLENPAFLNGKSCYVSLYFYPEHLLERMTMLCFYGKGNNPLALQYENGRLQVRGPRNLGDRSNIYPTNASITAGKWYFLEFLMDGKSWQVWLNGRQVMNMENANTVPGGGYDPQEPVNVYVSRPTSPSGFVTERILIGNLYCPHVHERDRFVGVLDEVKIADSLPPAEERQKALALRKAAPLPAPVVPAAATAIKADEKPISAKMDAKHFSMIFDGKTEPAMIYAGGGFLRSGPYGLETVRDAFDCGMSVFRSTAEGGRDFCGGWWWYGMGKYDFTIVDRYLDSVFRWNPDAKILLSLPASPPRWWGEQFPDEQCQDFKGHIKHDYFASHAYSSKKWLKDLEEAWTAFFEHLKTTPYANRIIGYVPVSGRYGEGLRACFNSQLYGKEFTDYSPAERTAYREWLAKTYGDIAKMKKAYAPGVVPDDFAKTDVPPPEARARQDGYFADPVIDRGNIDYMFFVNDNSADAVIQFTTVLRRLAGPDKFIGFYYGYMLEDVLGQGRAWVSDSGHMAVGKVLRQAPINFLCSPIGYHQRNLGCVGPTMAAAASARLHNVLWLDEADIRTSLSVPGHKAEYSGAKDLEESLAVLWRSFGNTLAFRYGMWWFPISGGQSYSHPRIWEAFRTMNREMRETAAKQPETIDHSKSVAMIIDPYSNHFRHHSFHDPLSGNLLTNSRDVFAKSAIEYDYYITDDLDLIPDDYPVYVFLNCFYLPDARREIIAKRFQKDGKLLVWTYGAGYFRHAEFSDPLTADVKDVSAMTGITMGISQTEAALDSKPVANAPVKVPALSLPGKYRPVFFVNDPKATALSSFAAPELAGKCAVAVKDMGKYRTAYIGTPEFTPDLVRALARYGGAHVWSDAQNVVVHPGNGHVLIHSGHQDNVNLTFPVTAAKVVDVATGKVVGTNVKTLTVPIGENRSILLRVEEK